MEICIKSIALRNLLNISEETSIPIQNIVYISSSDISDNIELRLKDLFATGWVYLIVDLSTGKTFIKDIMSTYIGMEPYSYYDMGSLTKNQVNNIATELVHGTEFPIMQ